MACQEIAAPDLLFDKYCFPAANHISDAKMPPKIQCCCAKAETVPIGNRIIAVYAS